MKFLYFFFFIILNSCGLVLKENYLSEKNFLELPSLEFGKKTTENLDKSDELKKKLKPENFASVVGIGDTVTKKLSESFMFSKTANLLDIKPPEPGDIFILNKDKLPFVKFELPPDVKVSAPIPKPVVAPKIPLLE